MSWSKSYERWNQAEQLDSELKKLLADAEGNEQLLEDFFYKNLEFGTGGMRGEIGRYEQDEYLHGPQSICRTCGVYRKTGRRREKKRGCDRIRLPS